MFSQEFTRQAVAQLIFIIEMYAMNTTKYVSMLAFVLNTIFYLNSNLKGFIKLFLL
jgi:hypothetical protein